MVTNNIITDWQIEESIVKINTSISKAAFARNMSEKIKKVLIHEEKVSSKGKETQFRRNNEKSEEIGQKYRIMKVLQSEANEIFKIKNESLLSRTQNSERCQTLTAEFTKPDCLQSTCDPSDPYRSIDGCCNNLESPTQGIFMQTNPQLLNCSSCRYGR